MVRIEFQIERLKLEVEQCVKNVENIKMEVSDQMKRNQRELRERVEASVVSEIANVTAVIQSKIGGLQDLKGKAVTPTIAFRARLRSRVNLVNEQTIVFPTVIFNEGDAYNPGTGKFTAPVSGTYLFSVTFCVNRNKGLVVGLMIEETEYRIPYVYGDDGDGCSSAETVVIVTIGQKVWIEVKPGGNTGTVLSQDMYRPNTFSGTIINRI